MYKLLFILFIINLYAQNNIFKICYCFCNIGIAKSRGCQFDEFTGPQRKLDVRYEFGFKFFKKLVWF